MTKIAICNACNAEVYFDAYADINGEIVEKFDNWDCSECNNRGKYEDSGRGYTIQEVENVD